MQTKTLLSGVIATGAGTAEKVDQRARTLQATGATSAGAGAATLAIEVSNTGADNTWLTYDTISLTLSATPATAGVEMDAPWSFVRGNVTAISGTDAAVSLFMGV